MAKPLEGGQLIVFITLIIAETRRAARNKLREEDLVWLTVTEM